MKKIVLSLIAVAMLFAISSNISFAQSNLEPLPEPCWNPNLNPGCDPVGLNTIYLKVDECPNCYVGVQYYYKECFGEFELQIMRWFWGDYVGYDNVSCRNCLNNLDILSLLYVKLLIFHGRNHEQGSWNYYIEQKSCIRSYGGESVAENQITIPAGSRVIGGQIGDIESGSSPSSGLLDYTLNDFIVLDHDVTIYTGPTSQVCDTECCCYEVNLITVKPDDELIGVRAEDWCTGVEPSQEECTDDCVGSCDDNKFTWNSTTGVSRNKFAVNSMGYDEVMDIFISPNPNSGNFTLKIDTQLEGSYSFSIVDLHGRPIDTFDKDLSTSVFEHNYKLDLTSGAYFLIIKFENNMVYSKEIIIQ